MVGVSPRTELVVDDVGQFLEVFVFTGGQSAPDFRVVLEVVVADDVANDVLLRRQRSPILSFRV